MQRLPSSSAGRVHTDFRSRAASAASHKTTPSSAPTFGGRRRHAERRHQTQCAAVPLLERANRKRVHHARATASTPAPLAHALPGSIVACPRSAATHDLVSRRTRGVQTSPQARRHLSRPARAVAACPVRRPSSLSAQRAVAAAPAPPDRPTPPPPRPRARARSLWLIHWRTRSVRPRERDRLAHRCRCGAAHASPAAQLATARRPLRAHDAPAADMARSAVAPRLRSRSAWKRVWSWLSAGV
jgi:hypothetical protein